jgi:glucose-6-phosphate isomerase, archaeal
MLTPASYLNHFDPETGHLRGATPLERRLSQLEGCFASEASYRTALTVQGDPLVYSVSSLELGSGDGDLHIGIGKIMPGRVGNEYFLTKGHLHAWRAAAEMYIGLTGEGIMLLEGENGDLSALPLTPQSLVYVPGYTAHRTVNTGTEALTYLGIYPAKAGHDYGAIATNNFQQVVIAVNGKAVVIERAAFLETLLGAAPRA